MERQKSTRDGKVALPKAELLCVYIQTGTYTIYYVLYSGRQILDSMGLGRWTPFKLILPHFHFHSLRRHLLGSLPGFQHHHPHLHHTLHHFLPLSYTESAEPSACDP